MFASTVDYSTLFFSTGGTVVPLRDFVNQLDYKKFEIALNFSKVPLLFFSIINPFFAALNLASPWPVASIRWRRRHHPFALLPRCSRRLRMRLRPSYLPHP
jgi:hypothetical protein